MVNALLKLKKNNTRKKRQTSFEKKQQMDAQTMFSEPREELRNGRASKTDLLLH